jgi:hypothetical protein
VRYDPRNGHNGLEERTQMKKLMTLMLGLALSLGCVTATYAQDTTKKKAKKSGKKGKKKTDSTQKM